jgi:hypothetical protein
VDGLRQDLTGAVRSLSRTPKFAAAVIVTLALGLGANTAVFGVLDAVVLTPLPYPSPDRLVRLYKFSRGEDNYLPGPAVIAFRDQSTTVEFVAGVIVGLGFGLAATRALTRLLYGVSERDPLTFASIRCTPCAASRNGLHGCTVSGMTDRAARLGAAMRIAALLVALFIVVVGVVGLGSPDSVTAVRRQYFATPTRLYTAAAVRLVMGLVMILGAATSRAPKTLRVFGGLMCMQGLSAAILGPEHARAVLEWEAMHPALLRAGAIVALATGVFMVFAVATGRRPTPIS